MIMANKPGAGRKPVPETLRKRQRSLALSDAQWEALQELSERHGVSMSGLIGQMIDELAHGRKPHA